MPLPHTHYPLDVALKFIFEERMQNFDRKAALLPRSVEAGNFVRWGEEEAEAISGGRWNLPVCKHTPQEPG
jgi:hypothetical protein